MAILKRLSGDFAGDGYRAKTFRGTLLTVLAFGGENFLRLAANLILTRLLFPEAFGLMALVGVVLTAVVMFSDLGISVSIIQDKRGEERDFLNTAWTLQIIRGFVLGLAVLLLAHPLAAFYEEQMLADLLMISAAQPVIQGFISTKMATANRRLQLGRITILMLGWKFISVLAMVLLAWWLETVWALVIGPLIGAVVRVIATHIFLPGPLNKLHLDRNAAGRLISFGKFVFLSTLAAFFVQQGSSAVLGKFVNLEELAFFRIGFFLATVPMVLASTLSDRVVFPLYARRPPSESEIYREKINRARFALSGGLLVITGIMAIFGEGLVAVLYDARYEAAGPFLVLIAVFSMPELIFVSYSKLPLSAGRSGRYAALMIIKALALMGLLVVLVPIYGAAGAAMAPGFAVVLTYPFLVWIIFPFRGWDPRHDLLFAGLMVAIGGLIFWLKWPILAPLFGFG